MRTPCCEVVTALLWVVIAVHASTGAVPWWWLPVPLVLAGFGVALAAVDLRHQRLPDAMTLPAYPVMAVLIMVADRGAPFGGLALHALCGALAFGGAHLLIRLVAPSAIGAGDVKLAGSLGAVLGAVGPEALVIAAALAAVITLALAAGAKVISQPGWWHGVPHGPGLLAAAWLIATFPGAALAMSP